jgi:hypothetical protein
VNNAALILLQYADAAMCVHTDAKFLHLLQLQTAVCLQLYLLRLISRTKFSIISKAVDLFYTAVWRCIRCRDSTAVRTHMAASAY